MHKFISLLLLNVIFLYSKGQSFSGNYNLNFENPALFAHISFAPGPNNIWQIGKPQKSSFVSAYSPTNVIVTDKVNSYPTNNTSSFIIKNTADMGFIHQHTSNMSGYYNVISDTLTDFGKIEFSHNNGSTWIDLINPGTYSNSVQWWSTKPTLTGNSKGWRYFSVNIADLGPVLGINVGDTLLYKFTFTSDGINTNKDGLMYDNFNFMDYVESVQEIDNSAFISVYPNPASDDFQISESYTSNNSRFEIYNYLGKLTLTETNIQNKRIDVSHLPNGVYFIKYASPNVHITKKLVVKHN